MNLARNVWEKHKKQICFAMAATFFWGLLTHAYCFFNGNFSHDSLNELHAAIFGNNLRLVSGRYLVPLYRDLLRGDVTLPWLIGVLSLFWIGLAVFLVTRIFRMENKKLIFLTAGIFTVNITVSATAATYIHDLDCFMFSLLCSVTAVWLWQEWKWGWLPGAVMVTVSLAMYQSFLFAGVVLVMMRCILWLLDGEAFQTVVSRGLKAIGMILLGGIAYWIGLKVVSALSGIALSSGDYNSLDLMQGITPQTILPLIGQAYRDCFSRIWNAYNAYPAILVKAMTAVLVLVILMALVLGLKKLGWKESILLIALAALLPLGANMIYVLTVGGSHDLMVYAIWLFWLLALLLSDWMCRNGRHRAFRWQKWLAMAMVAGLLYGNVQFANGMYLKKDLEQNAYLSLMTRVADRMEQCEGYAPGETPVVFVGVLELNNSVMPGFKDYWNVTGMTSPDVIGSPEKSRFQAYFDYILNTPLLLADDYQWFTIQRSDATADMPAFPAAGSVAMQDGNLVVKLNSSVE